MRKNKLILLFLLCAVYGISQETIQFEMQVYFEDAIGHKDTITWGYSNKVDNTTLYPKLGEDIINTPIDSVFDIRVGKSITDWNSPLLGNKRISSLEGKSVCALFGGIFIMVQAKYNPVKISYDARLLNNTNSCLKNTVLSKNSSTSTAEPTWYFSPEKNWFCMASKNEIMIDTREKNNSDKSNFYARKYEVLGQGLIDVPAISVRNYLNGPCTYFTSIKDVETNQISVYPNPAKDFLTIDIEKLGLSDIDNAKWSITNVAGQIITEIPMSNQIDISQLQEGLYFLQLKTTGQMQYSEKFIKLE